MSAPATPTAGQTRHRQFRQMVAGLVALPLSVIPFLAYGLFTPEGRLLRDRLIAAVSPPQLPELSPEQAQEAAAAAPRYQGKVMALVYHGVGSHSDGEGGFVVSPGRFGEHLATLRAAGMATVTAAELAAAFAGGAPLPDNAVLITFDDGRADAMMFADPLLDEAGMRATMFLITSATDRPNLYYADWDRIGKAARSGRWDIQAHTHDAHREEPAEGGQRLPVLTSLQPGESLTEYRDRIREDLDHNNEAIEDHLGRKPVAFAYPFGAYGADRTNDPQIRHILREEISARYLVAFHQDEQESVPLLDPTHDRVGLRRLEVEDWSGVELLDRIRQAANGESTGAAAPAPPADGGVVPAELVAPPTPPTDDGAGTSPTTSPGRVGRVGPDGSGKASTTIAGGRPGTKPSTTTTLKPSTTTTSEPSTTTTTEAPGGTTTSTATSTTTTQPPTTTTTSRPSTTTTTEPPGATTSTTEKPCRGRGDKSCRR
ncbi:MAG: polysaccharide deacetylase family protein [Actinomycetota bacterium]|jgi:peptidoglycan/xylan/chitin deacetylase (PgdA/CDA1 family)